MDITYHKTNTSKEKKRSCIEQLKFKESVQGGNVNCSMASYICNHLLLKMSKFVPQLQITFVTIIACHISFFVLTPFS